MKLFKYEIRLNRKKKALQQFSLAFFTLSDYLKGFLQQKATETVESLTRWQNEEGFNSGDRKENW
jgi:hypothetical protein